ncbi:helix-turn-helix transcriptional regulator [uncultured Megasphaera sp.]|uniref:helix-turn-helix transcriptional regulator n=1 Tax=uncultured Megasphaera sp. TaxID=165188 RepID=UPI0025968E66|nr:helix-turn-helix transcriptional regulator [uncultured Megasphaera sp.]
MFTLKALRANKNWSQKEAAKAVGVSLDTWSNWERGKSFPDVPKICKIEKVFNTRYNEIIFLI